MTIKLAAIQMISCDTLDENMQRAQALISQAAAQGAKLICLPENFALFGVASYQPFAQHQARQVHNKIAELAKQLEVFIVAGSVPQWQEPQGKCYASSVLYNPQGQVLARYRKIHLFDVWVDDRQGRYQESAQYLHGQDVVCADLPWAKLGMTICYDVRFPELFQSLRTLGANLIVVPSAFTYATGQKHWQILLQARAIETQCYIIAANQGGEHSQQRKTFGHSMIIDPDGKIIDACEMGETIVYGEFDQTLVDKVRQQMPLWQHKRHLPSV